MLGTIAIGAKPGILTASQRTVVIAKQEWTTENFNVGKFRDGDPIPEARTKEEWVKAWRAKKPAWSYYDNDPANGEKYGRLYNLYAVQDKRGLAPEGWRIASSADFGRLLRALGGKAGLQLKTTHGWKEGGEGTDSSGFSALPAGTRYPNGGFYGMGHYAVFGTSDGGTMYLTYLGAMRGTNDAFKYNGLPLRLVREAPAGMNIIPANPPNPGILFVDHEATGRSGHNAHAITECKNGDILAFYANTSGIIHGGHTGSGWSEYKRSTDGGRTWSDPIVFDYSKAIWEENRGVDGTSYTNSLVCAAATAPDGTVIAFLSNWWFRQAPVYFLSHDNGHTWEGPHPLEPSATGDESGRVHGRSVFVHDGTVYIASIGGRFSGPVHLYASIDNGKIFTQRGEHLFANRRHRDHVFYLTISVLPDGSFIAYTYQGGDEHYAPYVISKDLGRTWSETRYAFMEKKVRNPQMSEKIGDYYFLHYRTGNRGFDSGKFVLYKSKNGIDWDSGIYLNRGEGVEAPGSDGYSANAIIGRYDPAVPDRLLIQSSISYAGSRVNVKHWWIENIPGTEVKK